MKETEKPIIILKNDAMFVDGELYDAFAVVGVKDTGSGVDCIKAVVGKFSTQSAKHALQCLCEVSAHLTADLLTFKGGTK